MIAAGHGRCFAHRGGFLMRRWPAIAACGLWSALAQTEADQTFALITDIGNDLMAGISPVDIAESIEICLRRLAEKNATTVLTLLPIASLLELGSLRFLLFRTLLFPGRRLSLAEIRCAAVELDHRLSRLAERWSSLGVRPDRNWYGSDAIHLKQRHQPQCWQWITSHWITETPGEPVSDPTSRRRYERLKGRAQLEWFLGRERCRSQPSRVLTDGTSLAYF
jgi:hypothetical protein